MAPLAVRIELAVSAPVELTPSTVLPGETVPPEATEIWPSVGLEGVRPTIAPLPVKEPDTETGAAVLMEPVLARFKVAPELTPTVLPVSEPETTSVPAPE